MALPVRVSRNRDFGLYPWGLMRRDFSDLMTDLFRSGWNDSDNNDNAYGVDIREDADHWYVEADMPGFRKQDIDISLENGTLSITAERRESERKEQPVGTDRNGGNYLLRERRYERFQRSFTLPSNIDPENIQAKLDQGCLTITLKKSEKSRAKRVTIN